MANLIYINPETTLDWSDDTTPALDLGGLAADAIRCGARADLGSAARSEWYEWRIKINGWGTDPAVGETVDIYLATSDGTNEDGDVGTTDQTITNNPLANLLYLGSATVQVTTAATDIIASGTVRITARYVSPVVHNNSAADALLGSADDHHFYLTPVPPEVQ